MLVIVLWHWVSWHAAGWIYSSNILQPLIQSDHTESATWECCWVVSQGPSLAAAQEKASQPKANRGSHRTSTSPSLHQIVISIFSHWPHFQDLPSYPLLCGVFPLTHIKPPWGALARAWPVLRGTPFLCLEGEVLIMEPTIASAFFAATRCSWPVFSYDLLETQDLSHRTSPFVAYPLLVQVIIPG